ncbi:hypothetical protein [Mycobacterium sp.]|uniref:hypothetical protein n=1 Tax=Mycobacterium sp. TaxID=1785 RepID=UPI0031D0C637
MTIFGRSPARRRLRRASWEALKIPAFSDPVDCTPWVVGGLWPVELSPITPETASLAEYLNADLEGIAQAANEQLKDVSRAGMVEPVRQREMARVITRARARAGRRVEAARRQLRSLAQDPPTERLWPV